MQGNRKVTSSGAGHPDRNEQFMHIQRLTKRAIKGENPVISVDTKKKEVLGAYKNGGKPRGGGCRVEPGGYPPGAPTDPDVPNFRTAGPADLRSEASGSSGKRFA
jgi:hypothetical protein